MMQLIYVHIYGMQNNLFTCLCRAFQNINSFHLIVIKKNRLKCHFLPSFTWYKTCDISLKIYTYTSVTQNQTIQTHKYLIASNYGRSCLVASGNSIITKQVDILISKSQTLQHYTLNIMYIKLHKIIMDKKPTKSMKI